jgi:hypothetical protein
VFLSWIPAPGFRWDKLRGNDKAQIIVKAYQRHRTMLVKNGAIESLLGIFFPAATRCDP